MDNTLKPKEKQCQPNKYKPDQALGSKWLIVNQHTQQELRGW